MHYVCIGMNLLFFIVHTMILLNRLRKTKKEDRAFGTLFGGSIYAFECISCILFTYIFCLFMQCGKSINIFFPVLWFAEKCLICCALYASLTPLEWGEEIQLFCRFITLAYLLLPCAMLVLWLV